MALAGWMGHLGAFAAGLGWIMTLVVLIAGHYILRAAARAVEDLSRGKVEQMTLGVVAVHGIVEEILQGDALINRLRHANGS
jgi:hypothetical protein